MLSTRKHTMFTNTCNFCKISVSHATAVETRRLICCSCCFCFAIRAHFATCTIHENVSRERNPGFLTHSANVSGTPTGTRHCPSGCGAYTASGKGINPFSDFLTPPPPLVGTHTRRCSLGVRAHTHANYSPRSHERGNTRAERWQAASKGMRRSR